VTRVEWLGVLRFAHVLGAVLLLGNVIVSGIWAALGMRRDAGVDPRTVARGVIATDWCFTLPGGALVSATGVAMAWLSGWPLWQTPFVRWGLLGLGTSTALWLLFLIPLQRAWVRAATAEAARVAYRRWSVVGWVATVPLVAALWAMATRR
jgi:uncharacterized membrane protein